MQPNAPVVKHLVLIGGGHSHLAVLKQFAMRPLPGLAITLISREINAPYSGAMPAFLSGRYAHAQMHIDLRPLAVFAGARLIQQSVTHIDLDNRRVILQGRPAIDFDVLSINTGSHPDPHLIEGAREHALPVKPIDDFLQQWQQIRQTIVQQQPHAANPYHLLIIGGGPASVELALATQYRLQRDLKQQSGASAAFRISLVCADASILASHNEKTRKFATAELARRHIKLILNCRAEKITAAGVQLSDARFVAADRVITATGASLPGWLAETGMPLAEDGFVLVQDTLQSSSHDNVFVAGDAATIAGQARPKSGVYAVRQGKILAANLRRFATGKRLLRYRPQKQALALLNLGDGRALASRGKLFLQGRLVWQWKDQIDRRFIDKYSDLPVMKTAPLLAPGLLSKREEQQFQEHALRCAGCGAKVPSLVLQETLASLRPGHEDMAAGTSGTQIEFDDAAITPLNDDQVMVQSIDYLRAFLNDPYLFARIATNHSLNDLYAMGVMPTTAQAIVGVPHAANRYLRSLLGEIMQGCNDELAAHQCILTGGHSAEIAELCFGLSVNGLASPAKLLRKRGLRDGDQLILTKPLGTGTLLAADMRYRAKHEWISAATEQMLVSNRAAAEVFVQHQASACTDITGFGLAGHLKEMLPAQGLAVHLQLADIPLLEGARETLDAGIISSLHNDNEVSVSAVLASGNTDSSQRDILFDPQTAGGLLASVSATQVADCLAQLHANGYSHARVIGSVRALADDDSSQLILEQATA